MKASEFGAPTVLYCHTCGFIARGYMNAKIRHWTTARRVLAGHILSKKHKKGRQWARDIVFGEVKK